MAMLMLSAKETPDMIARRKKNRNAVALGRLGGKARIKRIPPERRAEIARIAAVTRWSKHRANAKVTGAPQ
jgi:hypothetical protein